MVIGPYGILRGRHRAYGFATLHRAGGVEPLPYGMDGGYYEFAGVHSNCNCALHGRGKPRPYVTTKKSVRSKGPMWSSAPTECSEKKKIPAHGDIHRGGGFFMG